MDRAARVRRVGGVTRALLATSLSVVGCNDLPPYGEALFVVDTDLPVPLLASELRLDVYTADGSRWYESRTIALPDRLDWPASFSIFNPNDDGVLEALVRIRIHPRGKVRDYRGERFVARPGLEVPPGEEVLDVPSGELRLVIQGDDRTPPSEPEPTLTVDRLVLLRLSEGERGSVRLLMQGECAGTMAHRAELGTCVATSGVLEPATTVSLDPDMTLPTSSAQGTFVEASTCTGPLRAASMSSSGGRLFDDEVCVDGGAFVFGNADTFGVGVASAVPERVVALSAFRLDRNEVTVGRWRAALAAGFSSPDTTPLANEDTLALIGNTFRPCTWSVTQMLQDREEYPLNCVSWSAARKFCTEQGGDLPTEAQWEFAAQAAARTTETRYPFGDGDPDCGKVVFGRGGTGPLGVFLGNQCGTNSEGPQPVTTAGVEGFDMVVGVGAFNMAGSMNEHVRDTLHSLSSACWARAPLREPWCDDSGASVRSARGGSWGQSSIFLNPALRLGQPLDIVASAFPWIAGFRCARPGDDP